MAHHNIFRDELATAYPTYGLALWEPGSGGQYDAVEVGDVGFIRRGYFQRLFNVLHPRDHPSHRNPSFVPPDHEQLQPVPGHIIKCEIRAGSGQNANHLCSKNVTLVSHGLGASASGPDDDLQVTFSCEGKQGALLSLPVSARSEDTVALDTFGKWMVTHIDAWFAFIRSLGLGVDRMEDIILVTGRHLTKSWINVAFNQHRRDAGVSFNVYVSRDSAVHLGRHHVCGGELKLGPTGKDLPEDQCIFIRGFRVARIMGIWPRLRGQAGHVPDTSGHAPEPGAFELLSIPGDANDPLHVLIQHIAQNSPLSDMALVHDDDLTYICGDYLKASKPDEVMEHLRNSSPSIQHFYCDILPADLNQRMPEAYRKVAIVATLSKHSFEALRERSPSPQHSSHDSRPSSRANFSLSRRTAFSSYGGGGDDGLNPNYAVRLNNFLQGHPTGNLTPFFRYVMTRDGRDDAPIHIATAKFRDRVYAEGRGVNKGAAKHDAAKKVYDYFMANGVPDA